MHVTFQSCSLLAVINGDYRTFTPRHVSDSYRVVSPHMTRKQWRSCGAAQGFLSRDGADVALMAVNIFLGFVFASFLGSTRDGVSEVMDLQCYIARDNLGKKIS